MDYSILNDFLTDFKNASEMLCPELPWKLPQNERTCRGERGERGVAAAIGRRDRNPIQPEMDILLDGDKEDVEEDGIVDDSLPPKDMIPTKDGIVVLPLRRPQQPEEERPPCLEEAAEPSDEDTSGTPEIVHKKRKAGVRVKWSTTELSILRKDLAAFFAKGTVPTTAAIKNLIAAHPQMRHRVPRQLVYRHFVCDTSSTDDSSNDISSTSDLYLLRLISRGRCLIVSLKRAIYSQESSF